MGNQPSEIVKTSLKLPRELWKAAHMKAMDEGRDLQDLIADAIRLYLTKKPALPKVRTR